MAKTHFPVSNLTDEGKRFRSSLTQLINAWDNYAVERSVMTQKKNNSGNSAVKNVTGAVTSSGLIKLTVTAHGFVTGDAVVVNNVGGTTEANGGWSITVIDANTFTLNGSVFSTTYTSGGTVQNMTVFATVGNDYFLGADANEKGANGSRGFAEIDSAFGAGDAAIRQAIARLM